MRIFISLYAVSSVRSNHRPIEAHYGSQQHSGEGAYSSCCDHNQVPRDFVINRETSGEGQWVHTSLLHSQIAMMDFQVARYLNEGGVPEQMGNDHPTCSPMGSFTASDGMLNLGVTGQDIWKRFCEVVGMSQWLHDAEFATEKLRVKYSAGLPGTHPCGNSDLRTGLGRAH